MEIKGEYVTAKIALAAVSQNDGDPWRRPLVIYRSPTVPASELYDINVYY